MVAYRNFIEKLQREISKIHSALKKSSVRVQLSISLDGLSVYQTF